MKDEFNIVIMGGKLKRYILEENVDKIFDAIPVRGEIVFIFNTERNEYQFGYRSNGIRRVEQCENNVCIFRFSQ